MLRKLLAAIFVIVLLASAAGTIWLLKGRQISRFIDRHGIAITSSEEIRSVRYEGNGAGGVLYVNQTALGLNTVVPPLQPPSVGSSKDGKLALAAGGKVFPLGLLPKQDDNATDVLSAVPDPGDDAQIRIGHSKLGWPTTFDMNFMTGASPSWKRHSYQRLSWTKSNGMKLEMLWRYEQNYDTANGWTSPTMIREGESGLIKIEIKP
jgi:hypothetical protein